MSSFSTFSPSFEQTYCCFRRAPSFLCSQLNEMAADDSPAENILIGTETSPKEIVAEPMECAGIGPAGDRVSVRPTASGYYHWREGGSILRPPPPIATRCAFGLQWTTPVTPTPPPRPPPDDALKPYRAKRSADRTPEPSGSVAAAPGRRFIVHQHAATRLHFDLRLELDGVLKSWAVPKGPSRDPADKRLAVYVEDHPIEYGDFEGIIPEGNYGAGAVIVWDRGVWVPIEDPHAGLAKGKLLFELKGYKLRGVWTLVKIKRGEKEWLLIKERDAYTSKNGTTFPLGSVLSGLTVEELRDGNKKASKLVAELRKLKAPVRAVRAEDVAPMLAETREEPFSRAGWVFEVKLDGYRMRVVKADGTARLITRNGNDYSAAFPELIRPIAALPYSSLLMDGELVILDEQGRPSFQRLQNRARIGRAPEIRHASVETPGTLYLFDLMAVEGFDLRSLPLVKRKALLRKVLPEAGPLRYSEHFEKDGEALYDRAVGMGLEGIVAKKADAPYKSGRSDLWQKIRADKTGDFVVVGYTAAKGSRGGFGALHLGGYADGKLVYAGRAGSGFSGQTLKDVGDQLLALETPRPPFEGPVPAEKESHWVKPELVAEVRYKEVTGDGLLRQPVFLRFRDDKKPEECVIRDAGSEMRDADAPPSATHPASRLPPPEVQFTNLGKVFWPEEGYTKGDLIEYYRAISPWMLPYLKDRPVVLTRYPDGIHGKSFYQKDAPGFVPDWIQTIPIWSEDTQRDINYFVCNDVESLVYLVNLGTIPLHIWMSRIDDLTKPDWCLIDLDPKEAPFAHVITLAKTMKQLCDDVEMPAFIKTTGKSGLQ